MLNSKFTMLRLQGADPFVSMANGGGGGGPATPDYVGAAQATSQGNLDAARLATSANRVNQNTPYGNVSYVQSGMDKWGNPTYTANTTLSPEQQQIYSQKTGLTNQALGGSIAQSMANPTVDTSQLPQTGFNPGQSYTDAYMARMKPVINMQNEQSDSDLANQGIMQGSQAYNNAKTLLGQQQNDMYNTGVVGGFQSGLAANNQAFGQAQTNLNNPINMTSALNSGTQIQSPLTASVYPQQTTQGADILGATGSNFNSQLGKWNTQQAQNTSYNNGLMSLAGSALMYMALA